ncbi:MAG: DUF6502 family protein [Pseudomonadota bacterium]
MDFFSTPAILQFVAIKGDISGDGSDARDALFLRALRGVIRPLVRALIAQGVSAPAFYQLIKQTYVEVAEEEFAIDDQRPTDSRITLLTGVHRRDVKAIRDAGEGGQGDIREKVTTLTTVLARWRAAPEFTDASGHPLPLRRDGETGSFEALARSVNRDIRPRTILDEMLRQTIVIEADDGLLHLNVDAFVGPADQEQKVFFFAENVGDHLAAGVDNLLADEPRFMERAVFYNRLPKSAVDALEREARERSTETLETLNRAALKHQKAAEDNPEATERFRYGVFFYRDQKTDQEPTS